MNDSFSPTVQAVYGFTSRRFRKECIRAHIVVERFLSRVRTGKHQAPGQSAYRHYLRAAFVRELTRE